MTISFIILSIVFSLIIGYLSHKIIWQWTSNRVKKEAGLKTGHIDMVRAAKFKKEKF